MIWCAVMRGDMIWHGMIWYDTTLYETTSWVWQHDDMITQYDFMSYHKMWWHWWVLVEKIAMTSTISMGVEEAPRCCRFAVSCKSTTRSLKGATSTSSISKVRSCFSPLSRSCRSTFSTFSREFPDIESCRIIHGSCNLKEKLVSWCRSEELLFSVALSKP